MNMNVKSKSDLRSLYSRKALVFVSLIFVATIGFFCFISVFNEMSPFVSRASDKIVNNETELKNAINSLFSKKITIALDNDIILTNNALTIPANKDITLTSNKEGFYQLIGANNQNTIIIEKRGVLRIDGIIVTHTNSARGRGINVTSGGTLFLYNGEITNNKNNYASGGGVCNHGSFSMYDGKIYNNYLSDYGSGGGVYNDGTFTMYGGEITNNTAVYAGGGVSNTYSGTFTMFAGKIAENVGRHEGGGVYDYGTFNRRDGVIFDNVAIQYSDIYSYNGVGELSNGADELSDVNDLSLRNLLIICVGTVVLMIGVVVVVFILFQIYRQTRKGKKQVRYLMVKLCV